ncbi:Thrombospondin-type laminin G domain and EAR repeat-containing protein [Holothuria leucospilota]|uniref:Thrombospondin-type laminin G domain and EAR repeat-containing protein n=1 Tax=Holothuria leucospilota TaxID=206669 RepID=A0A9Q1H954_HOLLE|nr:Thrombospondin-type laminin G domain and EAR repeat-containing protein [Holothuria leucospilota]
MGGRRDVHTVGRDGRVRIPAVLHHPQGPAQDPSIQDPSAAGGPDVAPAAVVPTPPPAGGPPGDPPLFPRPGVAGPLGSMRLPEDSHRSGRRELPSRDRERSGVGWVSSNTGREAGASEPASAPGAEAPGSGDRLSRGAPVGAPGGPVAPWDPCGSRSRDGAGEPARSAGAEGMNSARGTWLRGAEDPSSGAEAPEFVGSACHSRTIQFLSCLLIFGACGVQQGYSVDPLFPPDDAALPQTGLMDYPQLSQTLRAEDVTVDFLDAEIDNYKSLLLMQHYETKTRVRRSIEVEVSWTLGYSDLFDLRSATVLEYFHCNTGHYLLYNWVQNASSFERETWLAEWDGDTFVDVGLLFTTAMVSTLKTHFVGNQLLIAIMNFQFAEDTYEGISRVVEFDPDTLSTNTLQNILTYGASGATFFDYESETYLVVTNKRRDDYSKYSSELSIYQFMDTHFDRIVSHPTSGASDVVSFEYESFVYIVVGQFIDNDGNYDVGTAVYLFDSDNSQLKDVQILETSAVTDLEIFKIDYEIYLAVANSRDSVTGSYDTHSYIFWWSGHQFVRYQSIPSYGARQWRYQLLEGENNLLFLADYGIPQCLRIFELDDEGDWVDTHVRFFVENPSFGTGNESVAIESFEIDGSVYLLISKTLAIEDDFNRFASNFFVFIEGKKNVTIPEMDPLLLCQSRLSTLCNETDVNITEAIGVLNNTLKYSGDQETKENIQIEGNVLVQEIFRVKNLTTHDDHDFSIDPEFIEQVEKVAADIEKLQSQLPNLVSLYDDETIQAYTIFREPLEVNGTLTGNISTLYFGGTDLHACVSAMSGDTNLTDIAGCVGHVDVEEIDKEALRLEGDQNVTSHVVFLDTITVEENITVGNELNELTIPDGLLLTYSDQEVTGTITFDTNVTFQSSVEVKGQLNGLDIETDIVTTSQSYSIGGFKQFSQNVRMEEPTAVADGKTVDQVRACFLQVDLSEFETLVVTLDGTSHIFGSLTFENLSVFDADILLSNDLINDINITELAEEVVTKNTTQTVSGAKHFRGDLIAAGDVSVSGDVNNVDLSVEVVPLATVQTVHTPIRVENITSEESIIVQETVNGIDLSEDVVLTSGNQTVNGRVNFTKSVTSTGDLLFPSGIKIDSVDVSELEQTAAKITGTQTLSGKIRFKDPVEIQNNVTVNGLINGINISALNDEVLSKSKSQTIPSDLLLSANITFDQDLTINGTMDGYSITDFIPLEGDTDIFGLKHFSDPMTISGNVNVDDGMTTNCADLSEFVYEVLVTDGIQTLTAPSVHFGGQLILKDDLIAEGLINGINTTSDLVTLDGHQTVQGK